MKYSWYLTFLYIGKLCFVNYLTICIVCCFNKSSNIKNKIFFSFTNSTPSPSKNLMQRKMNAALVIRQKGESQNGFFLPPNKYVYVSGGKKCLFVGKFGVLYFVETPVLSSPFCLITDKRENNYLHFLWNHWRLYMKNWHLRHQT